MNETVSPWFQKTWRLNHPTKISFGFNYLEALSARFETQPVLLVTSSGWLRRGLVNQVQEKLESRGCKVRTLILDHSNPTFLDVDTLKKSLSSFRAESIIAIGGGSVLDLGKALAVLLSPSAPNFLDFQKRVKTADKNFDPNPLPLTTLPTTSGTGSEVTPFATLWDQHEKKKYSLAGPRLFPKEAILDPALTLELPWDITLSTGMDALSQCLESVWNKNAHSLLIPLAARGVQLALQAISKLQANLSNETARSELMEASLISGLCISQTRTALAHAISYPLTAHHKTPHGLACSFTLPGLWEANLRVDDGRMADFCAHLGIEPKEVASKLRSLITKIDFKAEFSKTISSSTQVIELANEMFSPGRADNNLSTFGPDELKLLLKKSLHDLGID